MKNIATENKNQTELFSSITGDSSDTGGSSKAGSIVVLICCLLTIFFGGWLSLIIAGAIYMPFRKQSNGWLIFLVAYILTNVSLFLLIRSIF